MDKMSTDTAPYTFDKDYQNVEQVRPFYADYAAVRADMDAAGLYPYNSRFKGRIASLAGTDDKNEDTAIYLLQTMHELDALRERVAAFRESGAVVNDRNIWAGETVRGTVVNYGFYSGGTGWQQWEGARLTRDERNRLMVIPKGKRNGRWLTNGSTMVRTEGAR